MTSIQTTIPFNVRKKCSFYGSKCNTVKEDFTSATVRDTNNKYTPTVKKVITFSSSESDSDSDIENAVVANNVKNCANTTVQTPKYTRKSNESNEDNGTTPPKQRRIGKVSQGLSIPSTPLTPSTPSTPSTMLDKLNLTSSPDKVQRLVPKKLFGNERYQNARKVLHSSVPESLPGRENELQKLEEFMEEHLRTGTSVSLYVSGPPGTGKTACLSKLISKTEFKSKFKVVYVNCTTVKSAGTIYAKIIEELGIPVAKTSKSSKAIIEKYLVSNHKMLLLILDELDQLESKKQLVLYSIFEWPSIPNSKLILVGIANALDLTDRILPRLQARCEIKPKLMHFPPYSKQQICNIISDRLNKAEAADLFTESAIQMLAGKVAAISGDIRRALDISRRVIELSESDKLGQVLQPTNCNDLNTGSPRKQQLPVEKQVGLKEVFTVINGIYGGSQNIAKEESTFPLQQKLLLCSLLLILNKGRNKDVTAGRLHEVYKKVCKKRNINAVDSSEFYGLCSLIETRGILKLTTKKEPRLTKINLEWDQEELDAALQDKNMMANIINDITCL